MPGRIRAKKRNAKPQAPVWPTVRRALGLYGTQKPRVTLYLSTVVITSLIGLVPILILREIVDGALLKRGGDTGYLNLLVGGMVACILVNAFIGVGQTYLSNTIGQRVVFELRDRLYRHLSGMSLRWFTAHRAGETVSRISSDVSGVQGVMSGTLSGMLSNIIVGGSTLGLMLGLDWRMTLFSVAFAPLLLLPARRVGQMKREITMEVQQNTAQLNSHMQETLSVSGALLVRSFGRGKDEAREFDDISGRIRDLSVRRAMVGRWFNLTFSVIGAMGPVIVYWYGGNQVVGGEATLGTLVAFSALLSRLFGPVQSMIGVNVTVLASVALFERIFEYLDLEQEIKEKPNAIELQNPAGHVKVTDVSFSYLKAKPVLHDMSFDAPPGSFIALVGHSGAGKTSTAYLIPRLYDVDSGSVTIDGHDVRDVTLQSLADTIGMVSQETYLFHDTIIENLRYGRPDATDEEVEAAARAANIHDFIEGLSHGYETMVGERGFRLSGGERQRIAIARALLKDPKVLILDEATSSVDSRTERAIQEAIDRLTTNRTTIAIAHRLSTVLKATEILVLDRGRVVERGTHTELLAREGEYAQIYWQQFSGSEATGALRG